MWRSPLKQFRGVMMGVFQIIWFSMQQFAREVLTDPFFWILSLLVLVNMNKRHLAAQRSIYGNRIKYSSNELILGSILASLVAGLGATIIMTAVGITFYRIDLIVYTVFLTFFFVLFKPDRTRLAYAGGIICTVVMVLSYIKTSGVLGNDDLISTFAYNNFYHDVSPLLMVLGIIHIIEGFLIMLDGKRGALPVFLNRNNKIVGAFVMDRVWVLPVIIFVLVKKTAIIQGSIFETPEWWPLFKPDLGSKILEGLVNTAFAMFVLSGYKSIAVSSDTKEKVKKSFIKSFFFGVFLSLMATASLKYEIFKLIASLFALIGFEALTLVETVMEFRDEPYLVEKNYGVIVVDTIPLGPAEEMGILPGEVVTSINNTDIRSVEDIRDFLRDIPSFIWVKLVDRRGRERILEHKNYRDGIASLGIITIPRSKRDVTVLNEKKNILMGLFDKGE
jgi:hypothetical protein